MSAVTEGPDLLERTRMALSEAGYDPKIALYEEDGIVFYDADSGAEFATWKAVSLARGIGDQQVCFSCGSAVWNVTPAHQAECLADRPLVRDCGITR